jgi:hypothetical protein
MAENGRRGFAGYTPQQAEGHRSDGVRFLCGHEIEPRAHAAAVIVGAIDFERLGKA